MNKQVNKSFNFINILCVGRSGSGKSTFINNFFDERLCNVGRKGTHQTQRINYYSDYKSNIRLYDTIGLEGDVSSDKIVDLLEKLNVELINCNEKIHLILYFIQDKTINFQQNEYKVFNEIVKYKAHIIFIQTKCEIESDEIYNNDKNSLYGNIRDVFKEIEKELKQKKISQNDINSLRDLYADILLTKYENFVRINQRKEKENLSKNIFGMNKLYKAIYDYLKDQYIQINSISKIEGLFENEEDKKKSKENNKKNSQIIHPIFTIIKDNLFLHPYKTINDILCYLDKEKKSIITKYSILATLSGINPVPIIDIGTYYIIEKKLKKDLAQLYHFNLDKNIFMDDKEKNKKHNKNEIEEANKEKNKGDVKVQLIVDATKGIAPVKFGIELADIINDAKNIGFIKNFMEAFANGLKSTILFMAIGCFLGGAINMGIIIYIGTKLSNFYEKYLLEDNGVEFIKTAINDYNNGIVYFKQKAEIKDN